MCVLMCMHMMSAYVCGVSICVCLCVCGGADLAWMMGLESWCCRAAGSSTLTEPVDVVLVVTGRVMYVYGVVVVGVLWGTSCIGGSG